MKQAAQEVTDNSHRSGDGGKGGALWLSESAWRNYPKDAEGNERPSTEWNWPDTDWVGKRVPTEPALPYPYGGPAFRHDDRVDEDDPQRLFGAPLAAIAPLARPVSTWSAADLDEVMTSPAFLRPKHADRERAAAMVRLWFEERFPGPMQADATGRARHRPDGSSPSAACEVPVRAHTREGGAVEVDAHCRSEPTA